jgi:hypothetical protein
MFQQNMHSQTLTNPIVVTTIFGAGCNSNSPADNFWAAHPTATDWYIPVGGLTTKYATQYYVRDAGFSHNEAGRQFALIPIWDAEAVFVGIQERIYIGTSTRTTVSAVSGNPGNPVEYAFNSYKWRDTRTGDVSWHDGGSLGSTRISTPPLGVWSGEYNEEIETLAEASITFVGEIHLVASDGRHDVKFPTTTGFQDAIETGMSASCAYESGAIYTTEFGSNGASNGYSSSLPQTTRWIGGA